MERAERMRDVIVTPLLAAPKPWSIDAFSPFGRNLVNTIVQEQESQLHLQDAAHIYGRPIPSSSPAADSNPAVDRIGIASCNEGEGIVEETPFQEFHFRRECDHSGVGNDGLKFKSCNEGVLSEQIIDGTAFKVKKMLIQDEIKNCNKHVIEGKTKISTQPKVIQGRTVVISPKRKMKENKPQPKMRQRKLTEILEVRQSSSRAEQDWCLSNGFVAAKKITEVPKLHQRKLTDMLLREEVKNSPKRKSISGNWSKELVKRKWESLGGGGAGRAKKAKYPDDRKSHRTDDSFDPSTRYKE